MSTETPNIFKTLHDIDVSAKVKTKNNLTYLSWASAWAEVKKHYPTANYRVVPFVMPDGNMRFWHDDGHTGWVQVEMTICDITVSEVMAIMDFKNQPIMAEKITSVDANKSLRRCLTKACALHGLGLYIYESEDMPESTANIKSLKTEAKTLANGKCDGTAESKNEIKKIIREAEKKSRPNVDEILITGDIKAITDADALQWLIAELTKYQPKKKKPTGSVKNAE